MSQWPMVKLGELISKASVKKAGDSNLPILSMTMHEGLVLQSSRFGKRIASNSTAGYQIVNKNQLVVGFPIDEGVLDIQTLADEAMVSPAYKIWNIKDTDEILPEFLRLYLRSDRALAFYSLKLRGTTARRRSLPDDIFLSMPVMLPPLEKQAEIAEVLRNSAQQITLQQNIIKQTSSICSNYYSLIQKDNYPELSLMNAGITKTSGKSITAKGNDPHETNRVLKVNAVSSGSFKPEESKPLPKSYSPHPSHSVCYGDLLFARASGTATLLGACTIVDKTVDNIFLPDKIWNLHTNGSPISKFYLLEALRSNNFRKIAESQFSSSTGVKNIKTSVLMNFAVKVPPPDTLNKFNQVFKYTASIIQKQKEKLALLEELHQSLATRAFAGQL